MATIPKTSVALLNAISADPNSSRWEDFYSRYHPCMAAYLSAAFPSLEQDDVIQEALIAFMGKVPAYRYEPERKGLFRNYLIGILKFKAIEALKRRKREQDKRDDFKAGSGEPVSLPTVVEEGDDETAWRRSAFLVALSELLEDTTVALQTREIFNRVAVKGESPAVVAEAFGVERNNVDQIKARMTKRLRDLVRAKERMDG